MALVAVSASRASAQVALDHYQPAPIPSDGFALSRPDGLKHLGFTGQIQFDYGHNPLVLRDPAGNETSLVKHQVVGHAAFALGLFDRFTLFAGLPVQMVQQGQIGITDKLGIGDTWFGGRWNFWGGKEQLLSLGAETIIHLPTAQWANSGQKYSGDAIGAYDVALLSELNFWRISLGTRWGYRYRQAQRIDSRIELGSDLLFGGYLRARVYDYVDAVAELFGNTSFDSFFAARATPAEVLVGAKAKLDYGFNLGAAAGPGISRGYGTPQYRLLVTIAWAPEEKQPAAPRDGDGDGVLDAADKCPTQAEDPDGFEDTDGCPDPDNDGDGVLDAQDSCPAEAEDKDGFADEDGCLDADNDGDEILDTSDKCPLETEDKDGFQDDDGCLDRDNDDDLVPDKLDPCPNEKGAIENHGCPAPAAPPPPPPPPPVAVLEKGEIRIAQRIEFAVNKDKLLPESTPVLEAVQSVLASHPEVKRLRVEGHTDANGSEKRNLELSRKRAQSVVKWLMEHGIAADRLSASGCGPRRPLEPNITADGRKKNRRVEFHLEDPAPAEPVDSSMCKGSN